MTVKVNNTDAPSGWDPTKGPRGHDVPLPLSVDFCLVPPSIVHTNIYLLVSMVEKGDKLLKSHNLLFDTEILKPQNHKQNPHKPEWSTGWVFPANMELEFLHGIRSA